MVTFIMGPDDDNIDDNYDDIGVDNSENYDINNDNHQEQCIQG